MSYAAYLGYSEAQFSDYQKLIDRIYPEKKLVVGYSLGWDVLCTVMQFLPFTLGMVLIVTFGDLFSGEERTGMVPILRSSKYGRASLLKCKLGAFVTITTVLWILFQLVMLMTIALTYTLRGATCTVLLFNGKPSIYGLNWLAYYLLQCAYSYLGTLVFTLFICCLSSILPLRLSMPLDLTITLLTGIPMNHFCYADQAFDLLDKCRAMTPSQLTVGSASDPAGLSVLRIRKCYHPAAVCDSRRHPHRKRAVALVPALQGRGKSNLTKQRGAARALSGRLAPVVYYVGNIA